MVRTSEKNDWDEVGITEEEKRKGKPEIEKKEAMEREKTKIRLITIQTVRMASDKAQNDAVQERYHYEEVPIGELKKGMENIEK